MNTARHIWCSISRTAPYLTALLLLCCVESESSTGDGGDAGDTGVGNQSNGGDDSGNNGGSGNSGNGNAGGGGKPSGGGNTNGGGNINAGSGGEDGECVPNPVCSPDPPPSSGDAYADCVNRINQFRTECLCMEPLARWTEAEDCADEHSEYDSTRPPHSGFRDDICELGGFGQNECPGWNSEEHVIEGCLQQMWDEGPPPTEECEGQCFQDHGHFINMTNPDFSRVACGFYTTPDGEVWSVQNFR